VAEHDPTYLGRVVAVSGASITVELAESLASGLAVIGGHTYRVGQVGSFVRIPQGYHDLFGVVCEVGANVAPRSATLDDAETGRWMRVELAGEAISNFFERGISQHPNIHDSVHLVTDLDLKRIYGDGGKDQIPIGALSSAENIIVRLSITSLLTRHCAILGSTGSGKSTTIASLLRSIIKPEENLYPSARILLLDIHGEYASALADVANVLSATPQPGERQLYVPYWALEASELLDFLSGGMNENQEAAFIEKIYDLKHRALTAKDFPGLTEQSLTVDSPIPFSLKQLWFELIDFETATFAGPQRDVPQKTAAGDAETLGAPTYTPHAMGSAGPFLNPAAKGIRRQLNLLRARLLDRRYDFLLHPGDWEPALNGTTRKDLDALLDSWLGNDKPLTILDLSGVPSASLIRLIGSILRIVYEALYWSREKTEGGVLRPLLIVMEEAHRYVSPNVNNNASSIIQRIAKEGRKYGIGAMLVSQRPSEVDETILSQCGTIVALRLSNPADRARVKGALPDNLAGLMDLLPVLRTGEAIIAGEAARLPMRCRITLPSEKHQPRSSDPKVSEAWALPKRPEGYDRVVASWRAQSTTAVAKEEITMERQTVSSSNLASVGYDPQSQTLEVEFSIGTIYQYFNVTQEIHDQLMAAPSKGQFLNTYIKNGHPYSRVA
jgi:hypothetical protein